MSNIIYFEQIKELAAELSQFDNVEQLRATVGATIHYFNPAEWKVIQSILAHSVTVSGVCWARVERITASAGCSLSTYKRALKKAEDIGLLERRQRNKLNGRRGSNFIVFLSSAEPVNEPVNEPPRKTLESLVHKGSGSVFSSVAFNIFKDLKPDNIHMALDTNFVTYGLQEIGNTAYIPTCIVEQIKLAITKRYRGYRFDADRNDIIRAVWEADQKLNECLRKMHPISNISGYWAALFEQQLLTRKRKRDSVADTVSPLYNLMNNWVSADRRAQFCQYILGGGRLAA